jgi:hypothetical protein
MWTVRVAPAGGWHRPKLTKVFWFFFSKKNCFLLSLRFPGIKGIADGLADED